jgi:hypothetical protein
MWLPFGSSDYERHGDAADVWGAISPTTADADLVLVPGFPLVHPDHAWLNAMLVERLPADRLGRYAEQPYALRELGDAPFPRLPRSAGDRILKWRAIRMYASQLALLGLRGLRGSGRLAWSHERVEWPSAGNDPPSGLLRR